MNYWIAYAMNSLVQLAIIIFLGCEVTKPRHSFIKLYISLVSIIAVLNIIAFVLASPANSADIMSLLQTLVIFSALFYNADGTLLKKFKPVIALTAASALTEISIILIVRKTYGVELSKLDLNDTLSTVISVLTLEIYLSWVMVILFISRFRDRDFREMRPVCLMVAAISALFGVISIVFNIGGADKLNGHDVFVNQTTHCLITVLLMILYISMKRNIQKVRDEEKLSAIEESVQQTHEFYVLAQQQYDDISKIRHDLRNQVQTIECLISEKNFGEAENSLAALKDRYGELGITTYCSIPIVNVITTLKINECAANSIAAEICLRDCDKLPFDNYEMCSVFSNLLDNAIKACKQLDNASERYIKVKSQVFGDTFILKAENSMAHILPKNDNRHRKGYGLRIIDDIAKKNNGTFSVSKKDDVFTALMSIPVTQKKNVSDR